MLLGAPPFADAEKADDMNATYANILAGAAGYQYSS